MLRADSKDFEILEFISEQLRTNGFPPSVREIGKAAGLSSTASVYHRLTKLENLGYLERDSTKNRALRIKEYPTEIQQQYKEDTPHESAVDFVNVPLLGKVAAGIPITAVQEQGLSLPFPADFVRSRELFVLKIQGESMINAGILDGDYIVVNHQPTAENGDIVVALVANNEEATVKTFYKENGHFRLQPENDRMEPILVDEVRILGKVISVFRDLR